jgi:hypothetical protein
MSSQIGPPAGWFAVDMTVLAPCIEDDPLPEAEELVEH